jgi:hypothetical protein
MIGMTDDQDEMMIDHKVDVRLIETDHHDVLMIGMTDVLDEMMIDHKVDVRLIETDRHDALMIGMTDDQDEMMIDHKVDVHLTEIDRHDVLMIGMTDVLDEMMIDRRVDVHLIEIEHHDVLMIDNQEDLRMIDRRVDVHLIEIDRLEERKVLNPMVTTDLNQQEIEDLIRKLSSGWKMKWTKIDRCMMGCLLRAPFLFYSCKPRKRVGFAETNPSISLSLKGDCSKMRR